MIDFPRPEGKPAFTAPWFKWFAPKLTLPEGTPFRLEGHTLLMTNEFFEPELVHLLVIIPKNNQKTTWEAALAVWHMLTVKAPRAYCGAADKEQASELYKFATAFVRAEPELEARLHLKPSTKEIRLDGNEEDQFKVLASDDSKGGGKKQGKNMTLGLIDELHAHANSNLFTDFRSQGFKRRVAAKVAGLATWWQVGKLATITTAGWDQESTLWAELVKFLGDPKHGKVPMGTVQKNMRVLDDGSVVHDPIRGRLTIARYGNGRNVLLMWASDKDDDPTDFAVVKWANPASTATEDSLEDAHESLDPWTYERYRMNRWTLAFASWIPANAWENLYHPDVPVVEHRTWEGATDEELDAYVDSLFPEGTVVNGALDMARYRDTAALVLIGDGPEGLRTPRAVIWKSGGPDHPIPYGPVYRAVRRTCDRYDVTACGLDEKYLDEMFETLDGEGLPVEGFPQSNERMCPAAANLRQAIVIDKRFAHDGDPYLAAHIMAAVARDVGDNAFKLEKSKTNGPPVDACVALAMAHDLDLLAPPPEPWAVIT